MRVISYGGGVQSTALCVLATQGKIKADAALFANVGDDSEHPSTVKYVRDVMQPWCAERGLDVHELKRIRQDGRGETLFQNLTRPESRSIPIPVRMESGAPGTRQCTDVFKVKVVRKWLRKHGATKKEPATVLIGFSTDEMQRVNNRRLSPYEIPEHPLLDLGLNRQACKSVIKKAGLPIPRKSACYFCPFHRNAEWSRMRRDDSALFSKSVELERLLNKRRDMLGKDHVYLTGLGKPLDEAVAETPPELPFDELGDQSCDEGYCWT
jgi:hypothetical protein